MLSSSCSAMPKIADPWVGVYVRFVNSFWVSHTLLWEPKELLHHIFLRTLLRTWTKQRNFMYDVTVNSRFISRDKFKSGSKICTACKNHSLFQCKLHSLGWFVLCFFFVFCYFYIIYKIIFIKYIIEAKPDVMWKMQLAHDLAWFLRDIMGS